MSKAYYWYKTLRKYKKTKQRYFNNQDKDQQKSLLVKLKNLEKRIVTFSRKWSLKIAMTTLTAFFSIPAFSQDTLNIDNLSSSDGFSAPDIHILASGGDFNNDGKEDLFVYNRGLKSSVLIFGDATENLNDTIFDGTNGTIFHNEKNINRLGRETAFIDLNNDGFDDIIVASNGTYAFVIFGNDQVQDTLHIEETLDNGDGFRIVNSIPYGFASNIVGLNDINGDGINDVALFEYYEEYYDRNPSAIVFGREKDDPFPQILNTGDLTLEEGVEIVADGNYWAQEVLEGDINGDGLSDLILTDGRDSELQVIFGQQDNFGSSKLVFKDLLDGTDGFKIQHSTKFRLSLTDTEVLDINNDGFDDIVTTINSDYYQEDANNSLLGVVYGNLTFPAQQDFSNINGSNGFILETQKGNISIGKAGDYNGDGISDLFITGKKTLYTPFNDPDSTTYILYGRCGGFTHLSKLKEQLPKYYSVAKTNSQFFYGSSHLITQNGNQSFCVNVGSKPGPISAHKGIKLIYANKGELANCNYGVIQGTVMNNENSDITLERTELFIPNLGTYYANSKGKFKVVLPKKGEYSVFLKHALENIKILNDTIRLSFNDNKQIIDTNVFFSIQENIKDLAVSINSANRSRPGFDYQFFVDVKNISVLEQEANVSVTLPNHFITESISDNGIQNGKQITWNVIDLQGFKQKQFLVKGKWEANVELLGDTLNFVSNVNIDDQNDLNLNNNQDILSAIMTGSYDPNDKNAPKYFSPEAVVNNEMIEYLIRFQNSGTDTAFTVRVEDTLSANLNWESFELMSTSHSVEVSRFENRLVFQFDNILLPDSNVNEVESHGFIRFKIKPKNTLIEYDKIENTAYIFFDFNPAIITNTVTTTIGYEPSMITNLIQETNQQIIYPNPSTGIIYLPKYNGQVNVYSLLGELKLQCKNQERIIDISELPKGVYVIQFEENSYKVIKE